MKWKTDEYKNENTDKKYRWKYKYNYKWIYRYFHPGQVSNGSIWHHQHHHQQQGHHNIIKFTLRYIDNDDAAGLSGFIQNVHVQVYFTFFLQAIVKMTRSLALGGWLLAQRHFHRNSKLSWIIQLGCVSWGMNWKRDWGQSQFSRKFLNFPKMQSCTNGREYSISWLRIHPSRAPISISSLISAEGLWLLIMRAILEPCE